MTGKPITEDEVRAIEREAAGETAVLSNAGEFVEMRLTGKGGPPVPTVMLLLNSRTFVEELNDGAILLHFLPVAGPNQALPPSTAVAFDKAGWERFKETINLVGEQPSRVVLATHLPGGQPIL